MSQSFHNQSQSQNTKTNNYNCDLFISKNLFALYLNKELFYFKHLDKASTSTQTKQAKQLEHIKNYISFCFGDSLHISNIYFISKKLDKKLSIVVLKAIIARISLKHNINIQCLLIPKRHIFFLAICLLVLLFFSLIVFNSFNPFISSFLNNQLKSQDTNKAKKQVAYKVKYDKDIYLSLYIVLRLLQKTNIQIQKISLNKNTFNIVLNSNSQNTLLNFAMKYKNQVKLKRIQKADKTYVMDISFAI